MPGSRDDYIISGHVAIRQRLAVDGGVGDHAGDVIGGIGAAIGGDPGEIILEIAHRTRNQLDHLFG